MWEVVLDALFDTLKLMPLLLAAHVLIEILENNAVGKIKMNKALRGGFAPLIGAGVGIIPQCGFSVVATNLYSKRHITLGTLIAVYIATSDEAIPILIADPANALKLVPLLLIKFVYAVTAGYVLSLVFRKRDKAVTKEFALGEKVEEKGCHGHEVASVHKKGREFVDEYILHPVLHTLTISLYIFIVNLILGFVIFFVTEEALVQFMHDAEFFQPIISSLVGLIPNCASSVAITRLYAVGGLNLGAAVAGLSVNAGLGLAVLFKENKNLKENLLIVGGLFIFSCAIGTLVNLVAGLFI